MQRGIQTVDKVTHLLQRPDGTEVKIVAEHFFGIGLHRSVGVYVLHRPNADAPWSLANDRPHPDWRQMSVDDYVKFGRSEMLRTVTPGELLRATNELSTYKN